MAEVTVQLICASCRNEFRFHRTAGKAGRNPSRCAGCVGYEIDQQPPQQRRLTDPEFDVGQELIRRLRLRDDSQRDHPDLPDAIRKLAHSQGVPERYHAFMRLAEEALASAATMRTRFMREVAATESAARRAHREG